MSVSQKCEFCRGPVIVGSDGARTSIPWLPPELVERLRHTLERFDAGLDSALSLPDSEMPDELLRDILAAVEDVK